MTSLISQFIIYGSPSRKSNSRVYVHNTALLSKYAQQYKKIAIKQIDRIKNIIQGYPFDNPNYYWIFAIFYNNSKSDASIELIFDIFQETGLVTNDNTIRYYTVDSRQFDKVTPRIEIKIYKEYYDKK